MKVKRIKASALQFAVLISVIVVLLLGSFLTLTYTHQFFKQQSSIVLDVVAASNEGVYKSLVPEQKKISGHSGEKDKMFTEVSENSWGGYRTITSVARNGEKEFTKMALVGTEKRDDKTAIYIGDGQLPLVLAGNTRIEGTAYISDKGVKPGVISGNYYNGKELVLGAIRSSSGSLPGLSPQWENNTKNWLNYVPNGNDSVIELRPQILNSFFNKTAVIYQNEAFDIAETLKGNILIKSDTEVRVKGNAQLENAYVIAPKITIEKGFKGNAHFLAEEQLILEENVKLNYPSSLILIDSNKDFKEPTPKGEEPILIGAQSTLEGVVIYMPKADIEELHANTSIEIAENTQIKGDIYCEGNLELLGTVSGAVYTNRFIANASGSRYVNHIYNGKVFGNKNSSEFCGLPFENSINNIVQWLY